MQISHEEARELIQFKMDDALSLDQKRILDSHLSECIECHTYASHMREVENTLRGVLNKRWNTRPIPLSPAVLRVQIGIKENGGWALATRTAMIGLAFTGFVFGAWQFMLTGSRTISQMPVGILPVPAPSTEFTPTIVELQSCLQIRYHVQENDTLESIAYHFSTTKESIMASNNMTSDVIDATMELIIPLCNSTPTGTFHTPTFTTTITPPITKTTTTPG